MIRLTTNYGIIDIELDFAKAPLTAANFQKYVEDGHYNGLLFHRVIPGFMIQGGGYLPGLKERPTRDPIKNEANNGLKNEKYTIAMARTNDPHSATSQFFINVANNNFLDFQSEHGNWGYAVFGKVVAGQEVVDKIAGVQTGFYGFHQDVPVEDVIIEKAEVIE